jgi:hypothetical protein
VYEAPPTETERFLAGPSKGNGDADFAGGLRTLRQEDGDYTYAAPETPSDLPGIGGGKKKKKKKGSAEVIKAVEIDDERRGHPNPSAMD